MDEHNEHAGTGPEPTPEDMSAPETAGPVMEGGPAGWAADDDVDSDAAGDEDLDFDATEPAAGPPWVGMVTGAGLALMVVALLVLLGGVLQAVVAEDFEGDFLHKLGAAFLSNLNLTAINGLTVLLAAVLAGLPTLVGAPVSRAQDRTRALALNLGTVAALVIILATPITVRARLHGLDLADQPVNAYIRWFLATYTVSTLGTAAVALGACLGFARSRRTVTPRP